MNGHPRSLDILVKPQYEWEGPRQTTVTVLPHLQFHFPQVQLTVVNCYPKNIKWKNPEIKWSINLNFCIVRSPATCNSAPIYPGSQPQHPLTSNHWHSYGLMIQDHQQMTSFLDVSTKVSSSLTLHHNAYVIHLTSSHQIGILSSHITWRVSTEQ